MQATIHRYELVLEHRGGALLENAIEYVNRRYGERTLVLRYGDQLTLQLYSSALLLPVILAEINQQSGQKLKIDQREYETLSVKEQVTLDIAHLGLSNEAESFIRGIRGLRPWTIQKLLQQGHRFLDPDKVPAPILEEIREKVRQAGLLFSDSEARSTSLPETCTA